MPSSQQHSTPGQLLPQDSFSPLLCLPEHPDLQGRMPTLHRCPWSGQAQPHPWSGVGETGRRAGASASVHLGHPSPSPHAADSAGNWGEVAVPFISSSLGGICLQVAETLLYRPFCGPWGYRVWLSCALEWLSCPERGEAARTAGTPQPSVWVLFAIAALSPSPSPAGPKAGSFQGKLYLTAETIQYLTALKGGDSAPPPSPALHFHPVLPCWLRSQ